MKTASITEVGRISPAMTAVGNSAASRLMAAGSKAIA